MDEWPSRLKELSRAAWKQAATEMRAKLLHLQYQLRDADFPVLLVFGGVDGAGKHELANLLTEWLDPRFIRTEAYVHPRRPSPHVAPLLRYWCDLPAHGRMGIVLSGWYSQPLQALAYADIDEVALRRQLEDIVAFEKAMQADGVLLLKFWMHLDVKAQHRRLGELMSDPHNVWQVQPRDWANLHLYDDFMRATRIVHDFCSSAGVPWTVVDGEPPRARALAVTSELEKALRERLTNSPKDVASSAIAAPPGLDESPLSRVTFAELSKDEYRVRLQEAQAALTRHSRRLLVQGRGLVLVFEGWDAAGKGGAIRRVVQAMDVRYLKVHRIAAPDDREGAHHYLWRFARRFPGAGETAIFDRSWYGRVLVERVEGFATADRWSAAYDEINRFERHWTDAGNLLLKFWLHISEGEQLQRFNSRQNDPLKEWKLTEEDWRNRDKWKDYEQAANDMLNLTHTDSAPWHVIGANDKRHARVAVIEAVNEVLARC